MAERGAGSVRYERKFVPSARVAPELEARLRLDPALFREAYPSRYVNNVYFDTPAFDCFEANARGLAERVKCRVRWYGELTGSVGQATLELKRKHGVVGTKDAYPLPPFVADDALDARSLLEKAELPARLREDLALLRPVLTNRYRRRYYLSRDGRHRVTLDDALAFWPIGPPAGRFGAVSVDVPSLILELKFGVGDEDGAARIASRLPCRVTRSSKYATGIQLLYGR